MWSLGPCFSQTKRNVNACKMYSAGVVAHVQYTTLDPGIPYRTICHIAQIFIFPKESFALVCVSLHGFGFLHEGHCYKDPTRSTV